MAIRQIRSVQDDTVDLIALRVYGDTTMTEKILDANPGLSALGPTLPLGTLVNLPAKVPAKTTPITLW